MVKSIDIGQVSSQSDDELLRGGWQKRTTLDEGRLLEVVEVYRGLGYEVFVQEFRSEGGCTACFGEAHASGRLQGTVWTRTGSGERRGNKLFD